MIPNRYLKNHQPSLYPPNLGVNVPPSILLPNILGMDFVEQQKALERAQANMQVNNSIDSLLHVHRRKLQRRAANRKSAQLSRARKKAHLEELTHENSRLQQLVDILDSQPELMFCINARGEITYISERTVNFVNISTNGEGSDEEPTHIAQILSKDSVASVLKTIQEITKVSPPKSALAESSMLFSAKVVEFQDSFGHPLVGYLRCARINRRAPMGEDLAEEEDPSEAQSVTASASATTGQAKKAKLRHDADEQELRRLAATLPYYTNVNASQPGGLPGAAGAIGSLGGRSAMQVSNLGAEEWNLTNFKMLTDCVSNLADRHDQHLSHHSSKDSGTTGPSDASFSGGGASASAVSGVTEPEPECEFVCTIRTSDSYFARYSTRSDLYMFVSTPLSTASMEAHDLNDNRRKRGHALGPGGSSSGSSGASSGARELTTGKPNVKHVPAPRTEQRHHAHNNNHDNNNGGNSSSGSQPLACSSDLTTSLNSSSHGSSGSSGSLGGDTSSGATSGEKSGSGSSSEVGLNDTGKASHSPITHEEVAADQMTGPWGGAQ